MKHQWLVCSKCGTKDKTDKSSHYTGTYTTMRCPDCCVIPQTHATLCRACCPSNHGTFTNLLKDMNHV